jgi:hypothetical protein
MSRRRQWLVIAAAAAVITGIALLGSLNAPDRRLSDPRRSTMLSGPYGARGLAETLTRLGLAVERRRKSFVGIDTLPAGRNSTLLALLDLASEPSSSEIHALMARREAGQSLFVGGSSGLSGCFGYRVRPAYDSINVQMSFERRRARIHSVLVRNDRESNPLSETGCHPIAPVSTETLLSSWSGRSVAMRLTFAHGGTVTLLADAGLLSIETLKRSEVGALVIPWFFDGGVRAVSFDEYHQGFGEGGTLWKAGLGWLVSKPGGWTFLQLVAAALVALLLAAVRFGPAVPLTERRRRSPLEHVDALASGLERAGATALAREKLVGGLRRRLGPRENKAQLEKLLTQMRENSSGSLRDAALAVEDAWEAMGAQGKQRPY